MKNHSRLCRFQGGVSMLGALALAFALLNLPPAAPVRADVGVQPVLPGGSNIQPAVTTPVQMAAEVVTMTVRAATEADNALVNLTARIYALQTGAVWYPGVADVEADFRMLNPTASAVSLTAWFPLASALPNADWNFNPGEVVPTLQNFQVSADGIPLEVTVSDQPNPQGADKPALPWASFPLTFAASTQTLIHVSYSVPLQPSPKGGEMALYYVFQTGAGWAGNIGRAELIVNLPYPAGEGTLSGLTHALSLPPGIQRAVAPLPAGAVLDGSQVRWTWTDFEPGPQDDFAVWLLQPARWDDLQAARAAAQASPQDGQAWLELANRYYSLSTLNFNMPALFGAVYIPLAGAAYQQAADLLPERAAPRAGLGLVRLAPYMLEKNAPADVFAAAQADLQTARALQAAHPAIQDEAGISRYLVSWLENAFDFYGYNPATATADSAALGTAQAQQTAQAAPTQTLIPSATPPPTVMPTVTPPPPPTPAAPLKGQGLESTLLPAAGLLLLVFTGLLLARRLKHHRG